MFYRILADLVVMGHFAFVLFVIFGGFFVLWPKRVAWIHVPCVLWAIIIELAGWICPLTPLEIMLRRKGEALAYKSGFIEHYILPVLYPTVLTRRLQITIGFLVFAINLGIYGWVLYRTWRHKCGDIFC
jgi:hypothetical protein